MNLEDIQKKLDALKKQEEMLAIKMKQQEERKKRYKNKLLNLMATMLSEHNLSYKDLPLIIGSVAIIKEQDMVEDAQRKGEELLNEQRNGTSE